VSNSIKSICVVDVIPTVKHIANGREPQGIVVFTKANIELRTRPESKPWRQYCASTILPLSRDRHGGVLQRFVSQTVL